MSKLNDEDIIADTLIGQCDIEEKETLNVSSDRN